MGGRGGCGTTPEIGTVRQSRCHGPNEASYPPRPPLRARARAHARPPVPTCKRPKPVLRCPRTPRNSPPLPRLMPPPSHHLRCLGADQAVMSGGPNGVLEGCAANRPAAAARSCSLDSSGIVRNEQPASRSSSALNQEAIASGIHILRLEAHRPGARKLGAAAGTVEARAARRERLGFARAARARSPGTFTASSDPSRRSAGNPALELTRIPSRMIPLRGPQHADRRQEITRPRSVSLSGHSAARARARAAPPRCSSARARSRGYGCLLLRFSLQPSSPSAPHSVHLARHAHGCAGDRRRRRSCTSCSQARNVGLLRPRISGGAGSSAVQP